MYRCNVLDVFCGYGEPTNALDHLLQAADYLRTVNPKIHLRLNTNGLSDLINGKPTAELLCRHFDSISVSLNEPTAEKYDKITRNCYGGKAFDAMLQFTRRILRSRAKCAKAPAQNSVCAALLPGDKKSE